MGSLELIIFLKQYYFFKKKSSIIHSQNTKYTLIIMQFHQLNLRIYIVSLSAKEKEMKDR